MAPASRYRLPALALIASLAFVAAHLAYEHFTGGVRSHHFLARADLPAISNGWGVLTLSVLGWVLGLRIRGLRDAAPEAGSLLGLWVGFGVALVYGGALAVFFQLGMESFTSALFQGLFLVAIALPIYRIECVLGFVMGMTFTFGGILPVIVATVFATISFVTRTLFLWLARTVKSRRRRGHSV